MTMAKTLKTADELETMILSELNAFPKCQGVSMVTIRPITPDSRSGANWKVTHVNYSTSLESECARPIRQIVERLQDRFDLD